MIVHLLCISMRDYSTWAPYSFEQQLPVLSKFFYFANSVVVDYANTVSA